MNESRIEVNTTRQVKRMSQCRYLFFRFGSIKAKLINLHTEIAYIRREEMVNHNALFIAAKPRLKGKVFPPLTNHSACSYASIKSAPQTKPHRKAAIIPFSTLQFNSRTRKTSKTLSHVNSSAETTQKISSLIEPSLTNFDDCLLPLGTFYPLAKRRQRGLYGNDSIPSPSPLLPRSSLTLLELRARRNVPSAKCAVILSRWSDESIVYIRVILRLQMCLF